MKKPRRKRGEQEGVSVSRYLLPTLINLFSLVFPFSPGERLNYDVRLFGLLKVGSLELRSLNPAAIGGESAFHFVAQLKSNPDFGFLFKIDDRLESYVRTKDFATLVSKKIIKEKNYENQTTAVFDYKTRKILYDDSSTYPLKTSSKDLLTLWYYFRTLNLNPGDTFFIPAHIDKKNYQLRIIVKKRTQVKIEKEVLKSLVIEIETLDSTLRKLGMVYLSDDEKKLPVIINYRIPLGSLQATLKL